jgi:hypothetical protein
MREDGLIETCSAIEFNKTAIFDQTNVWGVCIYYWNASLFSQFIINLTFEIGIWF